MLLFLAFNSFIGAYNTFPSSMKSIFHPRNLHLGHLAKSFAFRETPTELKQEMSKRKRYIALVVPTVFLRCKWSS